MGWAGGEVQLLLHAQPRRVQDGRRGQVGVGRGVGRSLLQPGPRAAGRRDPDAHGPVVEPPGRPVAVQHVRLQPFVRVHVRGQDRRDPVVMGHQPRDRPPGQVGDPVGVARVELRVLGVDLLAGSVGDLQRATAELHRLGEPDLHRCL